MRSYPNIEDFVRIISTKEVRRVKTLWKPRRVQLDDGSIFYLTGIQPTSAPRDYKPPAEKEDPEESFPLPDD